VQSEWRGVDMEDLVRKQLAHFHDLIGSRITLEGPPLHLSATASQSIGMALHELSTNASKYGALSDTEGRIMIAWRVEPSEENDGNCVFTWVESEGPPVARPSRRGFGSKVLVTMPELELDADVRLDYAPEGLNWRLACSAMRVMDRDMRTTRSEH
jgi:two-component sensor histidine kinase